MRNCGGDLGALSGVALGVSSVGSSAMTGVSLAESVNSVIAESGDRGIWFREMAFCIFFCLRVLGTLKE